MALDPAKLDKICDAVAGLRERVDAYGARRADAPKEIVYSVYALRWSNNIDMEKLFNSLPAARAFYDKCVMNQSFDGKSIGYVELADETNDKSLAIHRFASGP